MDRNNADRLGSGGHELVERLDALRRHANEEFDLARRSEDLVAALRGQGFERTADALAWRRRVYLRDLSAWIREINDAETVALAAANLELVGKGRPRRDGCGARKRR
jgi:hypothetical protein